MKKLKRFLLIDDSKATNFFNKTIIKKVGCVEEVVVAENGEDAMNIVQNEPVPEIIFLDINMPVMNGWDFLIEYQKLDNTYKGSIIILMLGAKLNADEQRKAEDIHAIKGYQEKMLTKDIVCDIVSEHFEDISTICVKENEIVS